MIYNRICSYTALTETEINGLITAVRQAPKGNVVCAGVWKGGDVMAMRLAAPQRNIIAIDSFEGLASPHGQDKTEHTMQAGEFNIGGKINFENNFKIINLMPPKIYQMFITYDTLKEVTEDNIAMLWLDLDHYMPTKACLEFFKPRLVPKAIVMIHDYGFERCPGIKKACDEFGGSWVHFCGGIYKLDIS